jgi:hypothetical protein
VPTATTTLIPVSPDGHTLIDKADADLVAGFNWRRNPVKGYIWAERGRFTLYMHRLIAGAGPGETVDHINRDPTDNRGANLRIATASQNGANRGPDRRKLGTTSRHKGVSWDKSRKKWGAYIHVDGKTRGLGRFDTEREAAVAYNKAALETWGEFARLNILEGSVAAGDANASCTLPV